MAIQIPSMLMDMPVPDFQVDPVSGSSGQTNLILNQARECFLYYEDGEPLCASVVADGRQGSWSINDLTNCTLRSRASLSTKMVVSKVPTVAGTPGVTTTDRETFLQEVLTVKDIFEFNANQLALESGPGNSLPAGYTSNGRSATRISGNYTFTLTYNTAFDDICVSLNPDAPSCTLDKIIRHGYSLTASVKLPAYCRKITLGTAKQKISLYKSIYEPFDAEVINGVTTNVLDIV